MSDLVSSQPIELTAAEADMVAGGINLPNISVNVQLNNDITVQNALGLAVLSPGATVTAANFSFSLQGNRISS